MITSVLASLLNTVNDNVVYRIIRPFLVDYIEECNSGDDMACLPTVVTIKDCDSNVAQVIKCVKTALAAGEHELDIAVIDGMEPFLESSS